jgi:glutamate carboxypeptidase
MRKFLTILLVILPFLMKAQQLSKEEQKLVEYINQQMPETMQLLEQMVNINSGTLNIEGVKKVGALLGKQFQNIGFSSEWIVMPDSLKRAGHLVVSRKGKRGKKLFLIGHLDTVFEPDMPANPYRKLNDSTATGQGVQDMKGGNLIILAALQALEHSGLLKNTSITAYFTGDEEKTGHPMAVSRADFIERGKQHDVALAFEGAQGLHTVAIGRRGIGGWHLKVSGNQAHSAGMFNGNYGAIYEAVRIVNAFREQMSNEQYLTFSPGIFVGGSDVAYDSAAIIANVLGKTNIIAPTAVVQGDLRYLREPQKDSAREKMAMIATTQNLPGTKATISFSEGIPGMAPTDGNLKLVELLNKISMDMGIGETVAGDPGSRGGGDISFIANYIDCMDGLGASGKGAHAPGETINLKEFPILVQRAAILIYRLTR